MLADPQTVTFNAVAKNLVRVKTDASGSTYFLDDGTYKHELKVSNETKKRQRVVVRYTITALVADPFVPTNYTQSSSTSTFTIDRPLTGLSSTVIGYHAGALQDYLGTSGLLTKLIGLET